MIVIGLTSVGTCWAADRFIVLDFVPNVSTITYDTATVRMLSPGRFAIDGTILDNPDVMRFKIKVINALAPHCDGDPGEYSVQTDVFVLGAPDFPSKPLQVSLRGKRKAVIWYYHTRDLGVSPTF
jgi:hypothetical protein